MTTIAYTTGLIAADTGVSAAGTFVGSCAKIVRGPGGQLAGAAGNAAWSRAFLEWVFGGEEGDMPAPVADEHSFDRGMIVRPEAPDQVEVYEDSGKFVVCTKGYAIGSGAELARAAFGAGCDAIGATLIAVPLDCGSRGPVVWLTLGGDACWPEVEA